MKNAARFRNVARYWRAPLLPGADMVTAEYYDHEFFTPHWHDTYTAVPVIEASAECYDCGHHVAEAGSVPVINPGELHTDARAMDFGWRYRVFYLPVPFVEEMAREVCGSAASSPWFPAGAIHDANLARWLVIAHHTFEAETDAHVDPLAGDAKRVETMKSRLADDLLAPVTLAELAQTVGLSTFHAARLFTRETGLAPHAWRNQVAHRAGAASAARGHIGDGSRGGERLHRSEPLHAAFQTGVRCAAWTLKASRYVTLGEAQEHTSASRRIPLILRNIGGNLERIAQLLDPPARLARIRRQRPRHHSDDGRRRALRRDFRHASHRQSAHLVARPAHVARSVLVWQFAVLR